MCTMLMPVAARNASPTRWFEVPLPNDAKFSAPGLARASATSSFTDPAATDGRYADRESGDV